MAAEEETQRYAKLIARTWADADFKSSLMKDPAAVLRAEGWEISDQTQIDVIEESENHLALVLPAKPSELSDEQLDSVAGGLSGNMSFIGYCTTCFK